MKRLIVTLLILLTGVLTASARDDNSTQDNVPRQLSSAFEPVECWFGIPFLKTIDCGYLTVPEDHNQPGGATVQLAVSIVHSKSRNPAPDPIIFLQGGPGGSIVGATPQIVDLFEAILSERDMIFLDQRGTGLSSPALACPEYVGAFVSLLENGLSVEESETVVVDALVLCHDRLAGQGVNLAVYTTAQNAADVEELRRALGYEQWNLYGVSYGTRLALTVMRDYPDGVRSVVLDSVASPNVGLYTEAAANTARVFEVLFEGCANDFFCNLGYPNLETMFYELVDTLNDVPITLDTVNPLTGERLEIQVNGYLLTNLIFSFLYERMSIGLIPGLIHDVSNGEYDKLVSFVWQPGLRLSMINAGMFFSVMCSDAAPFTTREEIVAAGNAYPDVLRRVGSPFNETHLSVCENWTTAETNSVESQAVVSDVPTLLLAGEYDPVTPPVWAQRAAETLDNGYFYEYPGVGHGVLTSAACPMAMVYQFLNAPLSEPDSDCIGSMRPPGFMLTIGVTRPWARIGAVLLGALAMIGVGRAGMALVVRRRYRVAWKISLRMVGWISVAVVVGVFALLLLIDNSTGRMEGFAQVQTNRLAETLIPFAVGVLSAFLFSPDDEPALEIMLAAPRRISWVLLERMAVMMVTQFTIALIGTLVAMQITGETDLAVAIARWLAPSILLSGIGAYLTISTRRAVFGIGLIILVWFAFSFIGDSLLPGMPLPWPLHYLQPFFWPVHAYLQPNSLGMADYWLNRAMLIIVGLNLIAFAVRQLRDEERVLGLVQKSGKDTWP